MTFALVCAVAAAGCAAAAIVDWIAAAPGRDAGSRRGTRARALGTLLSIGRRVGIDLPTAADLPRRIAAAGAPPSVGVADVMALKVGCAVVAAAVAPVVIATMPGRTGLFVAVALAAAGFLAPDAWLTRRASRRAVVIGEEVADVLDLLRVVLASGATPARALVVVGATRGGVLGGELTAAAARIALGESRADAYARLLARAPVPTIALLVAALARHDRHGTALAEPLAALAVDVRAEHARALTDRAARAAPKIQLVVALLLVPAVMLLVASALIPVVA